MAKALDLETSDLSFPGLMTENGRPLTGDSQGEPGDDNLEMFWFRDGDSVSEESSLRAIFIGFICHYEAWIKLERSSGDIDP